MTAGNRLFDRQPPQFTVRTDDPLQSSINLLLLARRTPVRPGP